MLISVGQLKTKMATIPNLSNALEPEYEPADVFAYKDLILSLEPLWTWLHENNYAPTALYSIWEMYEGSIVEGNANTADDVIVMIWKSGDLTLEINLKNNETYACENVSSLLDRELEPAESLQYHGYGAASEGTENIETLIKTFFGVASKRATDHLP